MSTRKGTSGRFDYKLLALMGGMFCLYFYVLSLIAQQCFTFFLTTFLLKNAFSLQCKHYAYHFLHFLLAHFFTFTSKVLLAKISQLTDHSLSKVWNIIAKRKYLFSSLARLRFEDWHYLLRKCKKNLRKILFWKVECTEDKRALISKSNRSWQTIKTEIFSEQNFFQYFQLGANANQEIKNSQNVYQKLSHDLNPMNVKTLNNMTTINNCVIGNFEIRTINEINFKEASITQIGELQGSSGTSNDQDPTDYNRNYAQFNDKATNTNTPNKTFTRVFEHSEGKIIHPKNLNKKVIKTTIADYLKSKRIFLKNIVNRSYNLSGEKIRKVDTQSIIITKCSRNARQGEGFLSKEKRKFKWKKRHKEYISLDVELPQNTADGKEEAPLEIENTAGNKIGYTVEQVTGKTMRDNTRKIAEERTGKNKSEEEISESVEYIDEESEWLKTQYEKSIEYEETGGLLLEEINCIRPSTLLYQQMSDLEGKQMKIVPFECYTLPANDLTLVNLLQVPDLKVQMSKVKKGIEGTFKILSGKVTSYTRNWQSCVEEMSGQISLYAKDLQSRVQLVLEEENEESNQCNQTEECSTCCSTYQEYNKWPTKPEKYERFRKTKSNAHLTKGVSWPNVKIHMRYDECNQTENFDAPRNSSNDDIITKLENYLKFMKNERKKNKNKNYYSCLSKLCINNSISKSNNSYSPTNIKSIKPANRVNSQNNEWLTYDTEQKDVQLRKKLTERERTSEYGVHPKPQHKGIKNTTSKKIDTADSLRCICIKTEDTAKPTFDTVASTAKLSCKNISQDDVNVTPEIAINNAKQAREIVYARVSSIRTTTSNGVSCKNVNRNNFFNKIEDFAKSEPHDDMDNGICTCDSICCRTEDGDVTTSVASETLKKLFRKSVDYKSQECIKLFTETMLDITKQTCVKVNRKRESSIIAAIDNGVEPKNITKNINNKNDDATKTTPDDTIHTVDIIPNTVKLPCKGIGYKSQDNVNIIPRTEPDNEKQISNKIVHKRESYVKITSDSLVDSKIATSNNINHKIRNSNENTPDDIADPSRHTCEGICSKTGDTVKTTPDTVAGIAKPSGKVINHKNQNLLKETPKPVKNNEKASSRTFCQKESVVKASPGNCTNTIIKTTHAKNDTKNILNDISDTKKPTAIDTCGKTKDTVKNSLDAVTGPVKPSCIDISYKIQDDLSATTGPFANNSKHTYSKTKTMSDNVTDNVKPFCKEINGVFQKATMSNPDARPDSGESSDTHNEIDTVKVITNARSDSSKTSANTEETVTDIFASVARKSKSSHRYCFKKISGISETKPGAVEEGTTSTLNDSFTKTEDDKSPVAANRYDINSKSYSNYCLTRSLSWPIIKPSIRCDKCKRVIISHKLARGTNTTENDRFSETEDAANYSSRYCPSTIKKLQKRQEVNIIENFTMTTLDKGTTITESSINDIYSKSEDNFGTGKKGYEESECNYVVITKSGVAEKTPRTMYAKDDVKGTLHGQKTSKTSNNKETLLLHKQSKLYYCIKPKTGTGGGKTNETDNESDSKLMKTSPNATKVTFNHVDAKRYAEYELVNICKAAPNKESGIVYYRFRPKSKAAVHSATTMVD